MEISNDEPEMIDVSELMLGLDDDYDDDDDRDHGVHPSLMLLPLASASQNATLASSSKNKAVSVLNVSNRRPRRSMVYSPDKLPRESCPQPSILTQGECKRIEESNTMGSSVVVNNEGYTVISENSADYDREEDDISPRSLSLRFGFKDRMKATKSGAEGSLGGMRLSSEGETTTSPSTPYSSSPSNPGSLLTKWFRSSLKERKRSKPGGFKSLFRESRSARSSDQHQNRTNSLNIKSVEADMNSTRAWHSFSSGNQFEENAWHPCSSGSMNTRTSRESSRWGSIDQKVGATSDMTAKRATLYTTNDRAESDAYEDCVAARAILTSMVGTSSFDEKSVTLHPKHERELKDALQTEIAGVLLVPTVYVRGEYIVGIDNIMQVYKKGALGTLLLLDASQHSPGRLDRLTLCTCQGGRFLVCPLCKGKGKLSRKGRDPTRCRHCAATGLLKCPNCTFSSHT